MLFNPEILDMRKWSDKNMQIYLKANYKDAEEFIKKICKGDD